MRERPSRYNFTVHGQSGEVALFNARTGCVIAMHGRDGGTLADSLLDPSFCYSDEDVPAPVALELREGGFVVDKHFDELQNIRERYWNARGVTPPVLTITTTMNCNLGCYYCYEQRSSEKLVFSQIPELLALAERLVTASGQRSLHVDWYGGEPLLNAEFIELASAQLQQLCRQRDFRYVACIISNGSQWPADVEAFVARHRLRQVQISFYGLRAHHNKRRRYRKGYGTSGSSSFDEAVALVDRLVNCTQVDVRFNIDRRNHTDLLPFIDFARSRGWFCAPYPAVIQPARPAAYSDSSAFMREWELSVGEFDTLRAAVRAAAGSALKVEESEVPDGFPFPKTSVCAALARNSVVVGAEGLTYRCGLQVGEKARAVGALSAAPSVTPSRSDDSWWNNFDPSQAPTCSKCSFLPVCWGGCPKKHLERDQHALNEQGRYWRTNLPRFIAKAAGISEVRDPVVSEQLQFRPVTGDSI